MNLSRPEGIRQTTPDYASWGLGEMYLLAFEYSGLKGRRKSQWPAGQRCTAPDDDVDELPAGCATWSLLVPGR